MCGGVSGIAGIRQKEIDHLLCISAVEEFSDCMPGDFCRIDGITEIACVFLLAHVYCSFSFILHVCFISASA